MSRPALSVQLYSLRRRLDDDAGDVLRDVAGLGLTAVEPYDLVHWAPRLAPALDEHGLHAPTAHVHLVGDADVDGALRAAALLGTTMLVEPAVPEERWTSRADLAAVAAELRRAADRAAGSGVQVGYHNHWWETAHRVDGAPALEVLADLLDDRVALEVDVLWAAVGGADPVALLERLGGRVAAVHLKDGPYSRDTRTQQPAGYGDLPVAEVLAAAPDARLVLEFDDYDGDVVDGLAQARDTVLRLEGTA